MKYQLVKFLVVLISIYPFVVHSLELQGVGRRVPVQIFEDWGRQFTAQNTDITIKYTTANSSEGVKQVELGTADFGDTDMPLTKQDLEKKGLSQFPYKFTAITPVTNLPNIFDGQLKLDGKILSNIYLGKITKWNDPAIVALNARIKLPNEKIIVAHQSADGEGSYPFSSYLSKVNPEWKEKVGSGVTLKWPVGIAQENLYIMGEFIKKTPYSIGYTEIAYARKSKLNYAQMQNSAGNFVSPHSGSIESAVQNVKWNAGNGFCEDITQEKGDDTWPISSASFIVIKKTSDNIEQRQALLKFLGWGLRVGDMAVSNLDFMPIKRTILPHIRNSWNDTPLSIEGGEIVTAKQVLDLSAGGVVIVDSRAANEFNEAHIANAINVPYAEKSKKETSFNPTADQFDLSKLPTDKKAGVVFYCNAGSCWKGYKAAIVAIQAGYKKVYWLRGGIPEWQEKNFPTGSSRTVKAVVAKK